MAIVVSPLDEPVPEIIGDQTLDPPIVLSFSDDTPEADPSIPVDPLAPIVTIPPVIVTSVTVNFPQTLNITFVNNVVTITGAVTDLFPKTLTYLDSANAEYVTDMWENIPTGFNALTKYKAPAITRKSLFITTNFMYHASFVYEIIVLYNFAPANAKLVDYVSKGKF